MADSASNTIACPICGTIVPVAAAANQVVQATCSLCATAFVVLEDGSTLTAVEWSRRQAKGLDSSRPAPAAAAASPSTPAPPTRAVSPKPAATPAGRPIISRPAPRPVTAARRAATPADPAPPDTIAAAVPADPVAPPADTPAPVALAVETPAAVTPAAVTPAADGRAIQGALQNLSVVDVLQLLYSSRKSGLLRLTGPAGVATIALKDGLIVGGNNAARGRHIGHVLVEQGAVSQADVDAALAAQREATGDRRPLVATLVARGALTAEVGWRALERLIEELVIDVLNWSSGNFAFEVGSVTPADDFRHLADGVLDGRGLDTQSTLLEALRAMDEHNRAGPPTEVAIDLDAAFSPIPGPPPATALPEEHTPPPEALPNTERAAAFGRRALTAVRPWVIRARARFDALPRRSRWVVAGVAGLVVTLLLALVAFSGDDRPSDEPAVSATPPVETPPAPTAAAPEPAPTPPPEPAATGETPVVDDAEVLAPTKKVVGKRKGKKQKGKDARSLFDAAIGP